ncbi:lipopolysaccharide biosynthesis protein [Microbacterium yannicii]|uniref:lipopolysaccharide biosynthesis protein n=1 Tax=Microbacterium yannicii TaxID=671622 RepID=UPI0002E93122|nr:lipopolysaccharide biosynthesis protein [Microbacterium yannicii]
MTTPDDADVAELTVVGGAPLGSRAASGVAWLTVQNWVAKLGGFVTVVILARLLTPADFGLVAVAMTVVSFVYLIADLGFGTYLIQAREMTARLASTAFWYSSLSGIALAVVMVLAAPAIEDLFGVDGVTPVVQGLAPAVVFVSLGAVPIAVLRRGLRFRALAVQSASAAVAGQIVAVGLAIGGAGVWALVVQVIVSQLVVVIAAWLTSRWRPSRLFAWSDFVLMFGFGSKVVSINFVAAARLGAENAIISNVLGAAALGQMSIAQRLVQTTQEMTGSALAPVSTVVFAQVREDAARLRRGYDRALSLAYVVIAPALTVIVVAAPVLVPFLFGDQWGDAVGVASALAVAAIFTITAALDHGLFLGAGRPGRWLAYAVVIDALTLVTTAVLAAHGIVAIALGFVAVAILATVVRFVLVSRLLQASIWSVARRTVAAVLSMGASALAGWGILQLAGGWPPVVALTAVGLVVLAVHLTVCRWVLPGGTRDLVRELRARLPRRGAEGRR